MAARSAALVSSPAAEVSELPRPTVRRGVLRFAAATAAAAMAASAAAMAVLGTARLALPSTSTSSGSSSRRLEGEAVVHPKEVDGAVEVSACSGHERVYASCDGLPKCDQQCEPVDCAFEDWGDWRSMGGCLGLCERHRGIAQHNNGCGKPCGGHKTETVRSDACLAADCQPAEEPCAWNDWNDWTVCISPLEQRERSRTLQPGRMTDSCTGHSKETEPCGEKVGEDCALSDWAEWTSCSASCGGGQRNQYRKVIRYAKNGGRACENVTRRTQACNLEPCGGDVDCVLGGWTAWNGCDADSPTQMTRSRVVATPRRGRGALCSGPMEETGACKPAEPATCKLSNWTAWSDCSRESGGGQTERSRQILEQGGPCPASSLHEIKPCNLQSEGTPCVLSNWDPWSACSGEPDVGQRTRRRDAGVGCEAHTEEVGPCEQTAAISSVNCEWYAWGEWTHCTAHCGNGTRLRNRGIKTAPSHGGMPCDAQDMSEVEGCDAGPCRECIDGEWGDWELWSTCSVTCGQGFRSRHREVTQHANDCGTPVHGLQDDYERCTDAPCTVDQDCELSDWHEWSPCSNSCRGVRDRTRSIKQHASGAGKLCDEELRYVEPCNPSVGDDLPEGCGGDHADSSCQFSDWVDWGACSATCGGGTRSRTRSVLNPGTGALTCQDTLDELEACNEEPCDRQCIDCKYAEWNDWSACHGCSGQRYRRRLVVQTPNDCGKMCADADMEETGECPADELQAVCGNAFCGWSDWSTGTDCAQCGPSSSMRERHLMLAKEETKNTMFRAERGDPCVGTQIYAEACPYVSCEIPCTPLDCQLSEWGEWTHDGQNGLCHRVREVLRDRSCGGKFCEGSLVDSKSCPLDNNEVQDCILREWSQWSPSDCTDTSKQQSRLRAPSRPARNGGKVCEGPMRETRHCDGSASGQDYTDCEMGEWTEWSYCPEVDCEQFTSSGVPVTQRHREIARIASIGAKQCEGPLQEAKSCPAPTCEDRDCVLGDWDDWSECSSHGQRERRRAIAIEALGKGRPCQDSMFEVDGCEISKQEKCEVSEWTEWDECDKTCGGGEQMRNRQVYQNPWLLDCDVSLMEIQGCNEQSCGETGDCVLSAWQDWGSCSVSCGGGQQSRQRNITQQAANGGAACSGSLTDTQPCGEGPCAESCKWGEWSSWSGCSCSCGGGQRSRDRVIANVGTVGSAPCSVEDKEQVESCNTNACSSTSEDGVWGDWSQWAVCSRTCDGGSTTRFRKVLREPTEHGKPVEGRGSEVAACNVGIPCSTVTDCQFSAWSDWTVCSKSCSGTKERHRRVAEYSRNGGVFCDGPLKQLAPCNPDSPTESEDVLIDDWSEKGMYLDLTNVLAKDSSLLYKNVAKSGGRPIDLVISQTSSGDATPPVPLSSKTSIGDSIALGKVSVPGSGEQKHFAAEFVDLDGNPVSVPFFGLRFMDLAKGQRVSADGYASYDAPGELGVQVKSSGAETTFEGNKMEIADAVRDPTKMTLGQLERSVVLNFRDRSNVHFTVETDCIDVEPPSGSNLKSCKEQATTDDCDKRRSGDLNDGFCAKTCGLCSSSTTEVSFAGKACADCGTLATVEPPPGCGGAAPIDCQMSDWEDWSVCTATCGGGQQHRKRVLLSEANFGGRPCREETAQVQPCFTQACGAACTPKPCLWHDWAEWSACANCAGVKQRYRFIKQEAECGGTPCAEGDAEEVGSCPRVCHDDMLCQWASWSTWDTCSTTCGQGTTSRMRSLVSVPMNSSNFIAMDDASAAARTAMGRASALASADGGEARRVQELVLAFGAGCLSVVAALFAFRSVLRASDPERRLRASGYAEVLAATAVGGRTARNAGSGAMGVAIE